MDQEQTLKVCWAFNNLNTVLQKVWYWYKNDKVW